MYHITPEQAGISSENVLAFYKELEAQHLSTHSVILSRGDNIFSECYWVPFHKDFKHRMYSVTKSFVSIAVGFCEQDGLISLDDPIEKYFSEYGPYSHDTTIREMLSMTTTLESHKSWFTSNTKDRVGYYFENPPQKYPGTLFHYDSMGSFLLGAMVERLTGKPFLKYLQDKCLDDIGFSKDSYCLQCPGGHSWADSGLLCTSRDLWRFARFVLNKGSWNGREYLNCQYITEATTPRIPNNPYGFTNTHNVHGYGYQFWGAPDGCFAAKGMGLQLAFCDPSHDFIMIINSDNQGNELKYEPVYRALYTHILPHLTTQLPEAPEAYNALNQYISGRKLFCLYESPTSSYVRKINGKTYVCEPNDPGIRQFRLNFNNTEGCFTYINQQGEKQMRFGFGHNIFHKFPQEGYSDMVGTIPSPGNKYDAAFSADWPAENTLRVRVQIIDKYMGNLSIIFAFSDKDSVTVRMVKQAENFLKEYSGIINAKAQ